MKLIMNVVNLTKEGVRDQTTKLNFQIGFTIAAGKSQNMDETRRLQYKIAVIMMSLSNTLHSSAQSIL